MTYTFIRAADGVAARRPEREARLRYDPQLDDPQPGDVRRDHRAAAAVGRPRRRGRRAARGSRGRAARRRVRERARRQRDRDDPRRCAGRGGGAAARGRAAPARAHAAACARASSDEPRYARREAPRQPAARSARAARRALIVALDRRAVRPRGGDARRRRRRSGRRATSTRSGRWRSARTRSSTRQNGSELGVIPAEHNRTPVAGAAISPWVREATVAIEDRRFYEHGGVDPIGILRAVVADVRAGKIVQGGSTITQELVRNLYLTRQRTLKRKLIEACLAIKLGQTVVEGPDPDRVHEPGVLRQPRVRHRGGRRDVLLRAGDAARRSTRPRCSPGCRRRRRSTTRSSGPTTRSRAATRCCTRCSSTATSRRAQYDAARADRSLHLQPGHRYTRDPRAVLLQLRRGPAPAGVRHEHRSRGRLEGLHDDRPGLQHAATAAMTHILTESTDPAAAVVSIDPTSGAIRAMTAVTPGTTGNQFNFVTSARATAGLDVQDDRAHDRRRRRGSIRSRPYLSAPFYYRRRSEVERADVRAHVRGRRAALERDRPVRQHRLRAVVARRRAAEHRRHGAEARHPHVAAHARSVDRARRESVTPLEEASAYATLAAGGIYSKPMAITKVVLADGKADTAAGWGKPKRERVIPDWVASTVTQVLRAEHALRHGRAARTCPAARTPARRARPTTTRTRGSPGTRRGSRRRCGSAIRAGRSRC